MAEEIDIFMAQIVRKGPNQSWGFRIEGGYNTGHPLTISSVVPGSPAGSIGLQTWDTITKIFDRPTKFLTHQQAADIIGAVKNDTLSLTVERSASADHTQQVISDYPQQQSQHHYQQPQHYEQQPQHGYQTQDQYPYHLSNDGQLADDREAKTYKGSVQINLSSPQNSPTPVQNTYQTQKYLEEGGDDSFDPSAPQSRSFRRLQNFMESSKPPLGALGLPPPRSASLEQMKQQQQRSQGQGRVKVVMSQKYNTPLRMYSADNVIDTFSTQVGSILHSLNNK